MSQSADTLEDRLDRIEALIGVVLAKARAHPVGRKVLAALGLE